MGSLSGQKVENNTTHRQGAAMLSALARVLSKRNGFTKLEPDALEYLPGKGLAHDHICIHGPEIDGAKLLLRVPVETPWIKPSERNIQHEAIRFTRAGPAGFGPRLFDVVEPMDGLPFGALLIEEIAGRSPILPGDMAAIAESLAAFHGQPLPPVEARPPLPDPVDSFTDTFARVKAMFSAIAEMPMQAEARNAIEAELDWVRGFAARTGGQVQPKTFVLTDTHPGNFLIDASGRAVFVDLEKACYGLPAIDLAHASLRTSTLWDVDCTHVLTQEQIRNFYRHYLNRIEEARAEALRSWLLPCRRLTWLRTMTFCANLRLTASRYGDWPPARLSARQGAHLATVTEAYFAPETIARTRAEWQSDSDSFPE